MPVWQRLLITLAIMLLTGYLVGLLWHWVFNSDIPSYLSGAVGGLSAVPTWSSCGGSIQSSKAESAPLSASNRRVRVCGQSALMPWRLHRGRARVAVTV
jgi:hypothetical protein